MNIKLYQVDYVITQEGFDQVEAESAEQAIAIVEKLLDRPVDSIEAFAMPIPSKCEYCDGKGQIETDNNGPIVDCPVCTDNHNRNG